MAIEAGQRLLHYRLIEKIGEGGMGLVWRAIDTTLDREAAIKVLPDAFAGDAERLARFEREARLLASLNHPNIATIYGVHQLDGMRFLAMELVPGEDLAHRLRRGRLTVDESLGVARQIATGLESAHARGVIHRDLKPANIRITPEGVVKILDFGLAKAMGGDPQVKGRPDLSPTRTSNGTQIGVLVGTAPYMSPEQARGQEVDERSDVWSFGCVLWECLTGRVLFGGATTADALGAVLHREPEWARLPAETPPNVLRLLRRCLTKDRGARWHHIADARIELDDREAPPPSERKPARGSRGAVIALALALAATLAILLPPFLRREGGPAAPATGNPLAGARFTRVTDFPGSEFDAAISPDGRFVVFVSDRDGPYEVFFGQVGSREFRSLTGDLDPFQVSYVPEVRRAGFTGDGTGIWLGGGTRRRMRSIPLLGGPPRNFLGPDVVNVAWSPDGVHMAYHERTEGDPLWVADGDGTNGRAILVPRAGVHQHFPVWSVDGRWIYFVRGRPATGETDLWRVRPDGRDADRLTRDQLFVRYPAPIDERTVLYSAREMDGAGPWLWAVDVETKQSRRVSVGLERYGSIAASAGGRRLVATLEEPRSELWRVPILERTASDGDAELYTGTRGLRAMAPRFGGATLFFLSSRGSGDGLWRLRDGQISEIWPGSEAALLEPAAVSPDGETVLLLLRGEQGWRLNAVSADGAVRRVLSDELDARGAADWSPDGQWIVSGGAMHGVEGLFKIPVDGGAPVRIADGQALNPVWSPDGDLVVYAGTQVAATSPLLAVRPDGQPVALPEIEVMRGGERARFLPDGSALVYMQGTRPAQDFWSLDLSTMQTRPLTRFDPTTTMRTFDVTPDGKHVVFDRLSDGSDIVLIERRPSVASEAER